MLDSFWAIPEEAEIRTPASILREQAAALTEMTHGVLVGEVRTISQGDKFELMLDIVAPALNDYRYQVLRYEQPLHMYPGRMSTYAYSVESEEDFVNLVKERLASQHIKNVLTSLLAQARELSPPSS